MTATVTPITAADRKRAGVPAEHMVRLAGRMALAKMPATFERKREAKPPRRPTPDSAA